MWATKQRREAWSVQTAESELGGGGHPDPNPGSDIIAVCALFLSSDGAAHQAVPASCLT